MIARAISGPKPLLLLSLALWLMMFASCSRREAASADAAALMSQADDSVKAGNYTGALRLLTEVTDNAEASPETRFNALNRKAQCLMRIYDYNGATQACTDAYDIAEREGLGDENKSIALTNLALVNIRAGDFSQARELLGRLLEMAKTQSDTLSLSKYHRNMAVVCRYLSDYGSAYDNICRSLDLTSPADTTRLMEILVLKGEILQDMNRLDEASATYANVLKSYNGAIYPLLRQQIMADLARLENYRGNDTMAHHYALGAAGSDDPKLKTSAYRVLSDIASRGHDSLHALAYLDSAITASDTLHSLQMRSIHRGHAAHLELLKAGISNARQRNVIIAETIAIAMLVVLIVAVGLYVRLRLRYSRERQRLAQKDAELLAQQLKVSELKEETARSELDSQKNAIAMKNLYLDSRNAIINSVMKFFDDNRDLGTRPEVKQFLSDMRLRYRNSEGLEKSLSCFEGVNDRILAALRERHPDLTPGDLRFIAYVNMQLSTKEISELLNISTDSCKKRKQRVSAKLGLEDARALNSYLSSL